jgi:DNA-3-methyladenine glycosylase
MKCSQQATFFGRSPEVVAPELLGWWLQHGEVTVSIVETEAYLGREDAASHAYPGPTRRNQSMFGAPGRCYIYRIYGMHLCFNVVCHEEGQAGAVLIRAGEVVDGQALAIGRRGRASDLANGPGRLGQALGLDPELDGTCLLEGPLRLSPPEEPVGPIAKGPRVGISKAIELPLRFWLLRSAQVSRGRPGPALKKRRGAS